MHDLREPFEYDSVYDLAPHGGPARSYLMATTQRTGSHYLAHLLARTSWGGVPFEYLNPHRAAMELRLRGWPLTEGSQRRLLREMKGRRTGATGFFGFKAHWHTWQEAAARPLVGDLARPNCIVHLSRRDRVAQAASLAIAERSGVWVKFDDRPRPPTGCPDAARERALRRIESEYRAWEAYLTTWPGPVLRLVYEDVREDPLAALDALRRFLGVEAMGPLRELPLPHPSQAGSRRADRFSPASTA